MKFVTKKRILVLCMSTALAATSCPVVPFAEEEEAVLETMEPDELTEGSGELRFSESDTAEAESVEAGEETGLAAGEFTEDAAFSDGDADVSFEAESEEFSADAAAAAVSIEGHTTVDTALEYAAGTELTIPQESRSYTAYIKYEAEEKADYDFILNCGKTDEQVIATLYGSDGTTTKRNFFGEYNTPETISLEKGTYYLYLYVSKEAENLTVSIEKQIDVEYSSQKTVSYGDKAELSVSVQDVSQGLTYQWLRKNKSDSSYTEITGATSADYSFDSTTSVSSAEYFRCHIKASDGRFRDVDITVYVDSVKITSPGSFNNVSCQIGGTQTLSVTAESSRGAVSYQWKDANWVNIDGATGSSYTVTAPEKGKTVRYICNISDGVDTVQAYFDVTTTANLAVSGEKTWYDQWPGDTVKFSVKASTESGDGLTYTWKTKGNTLEANGSTLEATVGDSDQYWICTVSDGYESKEVSFRVSLYTGKKPKKVEILSEQKDWYIYELSGTNLDWSQIDVQVTYEDDTQETKHFNRNDNNDSGSSKFKLEADGSWSEGLQTRTFTYEGIGTDSQIYIKRIGSDDELTKGTAVNGQSATASAEGYGYYRIKGQAAGYYELAFSGVTGNGSAELYKKNSGTGEMITSADLSADKTAAENKLAASLEEGQEYFLVVKSSAETAFTYNLVLQDYTNPAVPGEKVTFDSNLTTYTYTFTPSESGFYSLDLDRIQKMTVLDSDQKELGSTQFDTTLYFQAGKSYYLKFLTQYSGTSGYQMTFVKAQQYDESVVYAGMDSDITWTLDSSGNLSLSGTGNVSFELVKNLNDDMPVSVTVGEGITSLEYSCFNGRTSITEVSLPSTLTSIGNYAFKGCTSLNNVSLAAGAKLDRIGDGAFDETPYYTNVSGHYLMLGTIVLRYVGTETETVIPEEATMLGEGSMKNIDTLEKVTIREKLEDIDRFSLAENDGLKTMDVPGNVTRIEYCAFYSDTALESAVLNEGVEYIGEEAFFNCDNLKSITIPKSVTSIGNHAIGYSYGSFANNQVNYYAAKTLPTVYCYYQTVGHRYAKDNYLPYIFLDEKDLSNKSVTRMTCSTTDGTVTEVTVTFAETVLKEGTDYTVQTASPADGGITVTVTGTGEYYGSQSITVGGASKTPSASPTESPAAKATPTPAATAAALPAVGTKITVSGVKYQITGKKTVKFTGPVKKNKSAVTIKSSIKYKGNTYSVTEIAAKAFYKNTKLTTVTVPDSVKTIGANAFAGCTKLKKATLGTGLVTIGKNAFKGDKKLSQITIKSKKLKSVGSSAFKGINSKAKIRVPSSKLKAYKKIMRKKGQGSGVKISK